MFVQKAMFNKALFFSTFRKRGACSRIRIMLNDTVIPCTRLYLKLFW